MEVKIKQVEDELHIVGAKLQDADSYLGMSDRENLLEERKYLRAEKQHLRAEKLQLRAEELELMDERRQLRAEELVLMDDRGKEQQLTAENRWLQGETWPRGCGKRTSINVLYSISRYIQSGLK